MQTPEPEQQKKGLFSKKPAETGASLSGLNTMVNSISNRLRIIEDGYSNLRRKASFTEENMISEHKKIHTELRSFTSEINEVKKEIADIKNKMLLIIKELKMSAKKEDVDVVKRYVNLWEPVNFVTRNEVEKIVSRLLEDKSLITKDK